MTDGAIPKASARDHQRALRAAVDFAQGDFDIMPALAAEIGESVDWFVLALLAEFVDGLDRRFGRAGAVAYLSGRPAAASDAAEQERETGDDADEAGDEEDRNADELLYGLRVAVEDEVLNGDGTGEHFTGILNTSGLIVQTFATDALTSVRKAITVLDGQGYAPSMIVLHGTTWEAIELLTATSGATDVRGVPVDPVARRLWGYPVVINNTLGDDVGLVIGEGAVTLDHDNKVEVKWSDAVGTDFTTNSVRCRVEGRFGVSVGQPGACVKVETAA